MLYNALLPAPLSTVTAGITTVGIPADSSSPSTGPLVLTLSIDPNATQFPYEIKLQLEIDYTGTFTDLDVSLPISTDNYILSGPGPGVSGTPGPLTLLLKSLPFTNPVTLTVSATDGTNTGTASLTLTVADVGAGTVPPAPTNGEFSLFVWPAAVTVGLDSSVVARLGIYPPQSIFQFPAVTLSGLDPTIPALITPTSVIDPGTAALYTSATTPPGSYTGTLTAVSDANPDLPPPYNTSYSASTTINVSVQAGYLPPNPNYVPPIRGRTYGVVGRAGRYGPMLHRLAIPIQPMTPKQVNWRHLFRAAKLNWKSLGPGGANNAPTLDVDPQTAWLMQNLTYNGIATPGPTVDGVQTQATLGPCATGEAFQLLCQTTRTQLGLSALPVPLISTQHLAFPASPYTGTLGNFAVTLSGPTADDPSRLSIPLTLTLSTTAQSTPPGGVAASGGDLSVAVGDTVTTETPGTVISDAPCDVTANGSYWIFDFGLDVSFGDLTGDLLTTTGFDHTAFNVTNAVIHNNTDLTVSVADTAVPIELDTGGSGTITDAATYTYSVPIVVSPTAASTSGSITLTIQFTDDLGPHSFDITLTATTGSASVDVPCAAYTLFTYLSALVALGPDYGVVGFVLKPYWGGDTLQNNQIPGGTVPFLKQIIASPLWKAGASAPSVSAWKVIGFFPATASTDDANPLADGLVPAALLAAWQAVFNTTLTSGYIGFQLCLVNPADGTASPSISATVHFEAGTTTGFDSANSTCPYFQLATNGQGATGAPGDTITISYVSGGVSYPLMAFETDYNALSGPATLTATLPWDASAKAYPPLPAWLSIAFGSSTQTAPTPYPQEPDTWYTPYTITLSGSAPAGTYTIRIAGTLPTQTTSTTLTLTVT